MSIETQVVRRSTCEPKDGELTLHEKTVAIAEAEPRDSVAAIVRTETKAAEHFTKAEKERARAADAAEAKNIASADVAAAKPGTHLKAAMGGLGTRITSTFGGLKDGVAQRRHEHAAEQEEERLLEEDKEAREDARKEALAEVDGKLAAANKGVVVSEFTNGNEVVAYAVVPPRGSATGTGVAETHLESHVNRATLEHELAADAEAERVMNEEKADKAHFGCEAKAGIGGIGAAIGGKFREARWWISEKMHEYKGKSEESKGNTALRDDLEKAGEKAKALAEAEARRMDSPPKAHVIGEPSASHA